MSMVKIFCLVPLFLALPACGSNSSGGTPPGQCNTGSKISAQDVNDYSIIDTLKFPLVKVKPNTELTFDWSKASTTIMRHKVNPASDIKSVQIILFKLSTDDLARKLNDDDLLMSDIEGVPLIYYTKDGQTSAKLLSFTLNGGAVDSQTIMDRFNPTLYPPSNHTYGVLTSSTASSGTGTLMIQQFVLSPNDSSAKDTVEITPDSAQITKLQVALQSLTPIGIPANKTDLTFDWSGMQKNGLGKEFVLTNITGAFLGHYDKSVSDMETDSNFLELEYIATDLYRASDFAGTDFNMKDFATDGGKKFSGITDSGTWLLGLQCDPSICRNPAPWFLTVVKTCTP